MGFEQHFEAQTGNNAVQTGEHVFNCAYEQPPGGNAPRDDVMQGLNQAERNVVNAFSNGQNQRARDAALDGLATHLRNEVAAQPRRDPVEVIQGILDRINPGLTDRAGLYFHVGPNARRDIVIATPFADSVERVIVPRR